MTKVETLAAIVIILLSSGCSSDVRKSGDGTRTEEAEVALHCRRLLRELEVFGDNTLGSLSVTKVPQGTRSPTWHVRGAHPHLPAEEWTAVIAYCDDHWVLQAVYVGSIPNPKNMLYVGSYYWLRIKSDILGSAEAGRPIDNEKPYYW